MAPPIPARLQAFFPVAADLLIHDSRDLFPVIVGTVNSQCNPTESVGFFMALTRQLIGKTRTETLFQAATYTAVSASVFLTADYKSMCQAADLWRVTGALTHWSHPGLVACAIDTIRREMPLHCYLRQAAEALDQQHSTSSAQTTTPRTLRLIVKRRPVAQGVTPEQKLKDYVLCQRCG